MPAQPLADTPGLRAPVYSSLTLTTPCARTAFTLLLLLPRDAIAAGDVTAVATAATAAGICLSSALLLLLDDGGEAVVLPHLDYL